MLRIEADQFGALRWPRLSEGLAEHLKGQGYRTARDAADGAILATDPLGHTTRYAPDTQGYVGTVTSPLGRRWQLDNGPDGQLRGLTDPAGATLAVDYDERGRPARIGRQGGPGFALAFDGADNLTAARWPDGSTETFAYHDWRLLSAATDRAGATTRYQHDAAGRLSAIAQATGAVTRFDYGPWTRPSAATFPDGRRETYAWTPDPVDPAQAQLSAIGDADGQFAELGYTDGHLSRIAWRDGETISYRHDQAGRVIEAGVGEQVVRFTYDADGRLLSEASVRTRIDYRYDAAGNLIGIDAPTGRIGYAWDADLQLAAISAWDGSRSQFSTGPDGVSDTVHLSPRLTRHTQRTAAGHLAALELTTAAGHQVYAARYGYDGEDRLSALAQTDRPSAGFAYDAAGRLAHYGLGENGAAFAHDADGHRLRAGPLSARFDAAGKCLALDAEQLRYDARGRLCERDLDGVRWQYRWSDRGLLTGARASTGVIVRFGYDAFARRTYKRSTDAQGQVTETFFLWAGEQLIAELCHGPEGTSRREYLWYPGGTALFAMRIDGTLYYCHNDPRGAVQRVTDAEGGQVWIAGDATLEAPWGGATPLLARIAQPWRLPGQYHDPETGLCYNRYRYFDAHLARYLSPDPLGVLGVLGGLDLYAYADDDPVNGADPLGLSSLEGLAKVATNAVVPVATGAALLATPAVPGPLPILAARLIFNAVMLGINEALNQDQFCLSCILKTATKGILLGSAFFRLTGQTTQYSLGEIKQAVENSQRANACNTPAARTVWSVGDLIKWKAPEFLGGDPNHLRQFKDAWVVNNSAQIISVAERYSIPPELLAGIAWIEVGGDPKIMDSAAFEVRSFDWSGPNWADNNLTITSPPEKTSFGPISMQLRTAASTLGLDAKSLSTGNCSGPLAKHRPGRLMCSHV